MNIKELSKAWDRHVMDCVHHFIQHQVEDEGLYLYYLLGELYEVEGARDAIIKALDEYIKCKLREEKDRDNYGEVPF